MLPSPQNATRPNLLLPLKTFQGAVPAQDLVTLPPQNSLLNRVQSRENGGKIEENPGKMSLEVENDSKTYGKN